MDGVKKHITAMIIALFSAPFCITHVTVQLEQRFANWSLQLIALFLHPVTAV